LKDTPLLEIRELKVHLKSRIPGEYMNIRSWLFWSIGKRRYRRNRNHRSGL